MKIILTATDFSEGSSNASFYGVELPKEIDPRIICLTLHYSKTNISIIIKFKKIFLIRGLMATVKYAGAYRWLGLFKKTEIRFPVL